MFNIKKINLSNSIKSVLGAFAFLLLSLFNLQNTFSQSLDTQLQANAKKINVGEIVTVNLSVKPDGNSPVYTVSANLVYDPAKLDFVSATTDNVWMELNQKEIFFTDTINGLIVRTAGYPNGFLGNAKFVTYKFKAKRAGDTRILVAAGKAYDESNVDVGIKNTEVNLSIIGDSEVVQVDSPKENVFNLKLKIKSDNAFYRQDPYIFTMYHKAEEKYQQAITKIWVFDEFWNVHYEDEKLWRTDQDTVLDFTIPSDTLLTEGNFKIIAKIRYEDGVELEVAEKDIGVLSNGKTWFTKHSNVFMPFFFTIVFIAILHHLFIEREVYRKLKVFKKKRK